MSRRNRPATIRSARTRPACGTCSTSLEIADATLVGHSLGGGIALQLAYLFPDRVDALVLVSSGGLGRELNPLLRAATLPGSELVLPLIASRWVHSVGDTALNVWSKVGLPAISPSSDEAWRTLPSLADAETRRAFLATSRSVIDVHGQTVSAQNRLSGFASRPSMLIWGERDRMIPASHVETARRELPATRVEMFARSGHFPHLDEPDRFAGVLADFMAQRLPAGRLLRRAPPADLSGCIDLAGSSSDKSSARQGKSRR